MTDLAIVIVTWNVRELIKDALASLYADLASSGLSARVVVVDSASSDDTVAVVRQQFPQVELIASPDNLGFGRANNVGMKHLGFGTLPTHELPKLVYLLNPDTISKIGATRALCDALQADQKLGMVGANLLYEDGVFQHGAFAFPTLRQLWVEFFPTPGRWIEGAFNGRYARQLYQQTQPFDVDFTLGATMLLRREVILQTGMFDESFFMYCEEVDWAWRIRKAGWRIACVPTAHIIHLSGKSTSQAKPRSTINLWDSRLRLFRKHFPAWKVWLAKRMIVLGMRRKLAQNPTPDMRQAYQHIIELTRQA
jgi:GT2 family glycosyltransferase